MDDRQKRAATLLSLIFVVGACVFFCWLAASVYTGTSRGNKQPGRLFMLLIADWDTASTVFKTLPLLITTGLAAFGVYKIRDWLFYAIVAVSALGLLSTAYLLFELSSVETAKTFWAYSPTDKLQNYEAFVGAVRIGLGAIAGWFLSILAAELGIREIQGA